MPKRKLVCVIVIAFFLPVLSHAESCCVQQLNKANQQITEAYLNHDMAGLLRLYAGNSVSMPEYHVTLFGKEAIAEYQQRWMDSVQVTSYSRSTKDTTHTGHYLIETGVFSIGFVLRTKPVSYEGKYLTVWQVKPGGALKLLWEIAGSSKYLDRADLPLSSSQDLETARIPKPKANRTSATIQALNEKIAALVVERKGSEFGRYYSDDAMYGPYDMPMLSGKRAIDAYYREHEDPNSLLRAVRISASSVIPDGEYVLVNALYQVDWGGETGAHGTVTGKNITVWKRQTNGQLLMFRQMAVHD